MRILIIGKDFENFSDYLKRHGHDYVVLADKRIIDLDPVQHPHYRLCDFGNRESILKTAKAIEGHFDGVLSLYENYVLPAAWITHELGLSGIPIRAAQAATDKFLMRQAFAKAPETISPDFALVRNEKTVFDFAKQHKFPLIIKPTNLVKSLLVTKSHNLAELESNFRRTFEQLDAVYQKYAPDRQPRLIIEEFLEGSVHSVDAFIPGDGEPLVLEEVVDYQTGYDVGYDDNFHYSRLLPSRLSPADQAALRHCAALGVKALGLKNCPAHIEIIMTAEGPRIVEIGARNGGYRERVHRLANGIDIVAATLAVNTGQQPELTATRHDSCAVLELFPKKAGRFKAIKNEGKLRALPSSRYISIKVHPNDFIGKSSDGYKAAAIIILHHADATQFAKDLAYVTNHVMVQLQ